jgi:hypothetical protein
MVCLRPTIKSVIIPMKMRNDFSTLDICKALDIPRERLRSWMKEGFIEPNTEAEGQGTKAIFNRQRVYTIAAFKSYIERGFDRRTAADCASIVEDIDTKAKIEFCLFLNASSPVVGLINNLKIDEKIKDEKVLSLDFLGSPKFKTNKPKFKTSQPKFKTSRLNGPAEKIDLTEVTGLHRIANLPRLAGFGFYNFTSLIAYLKKYEHSKKDVVKIDSIEFIEIFNFGAIKRRVDILLSALEG